MVQQIYRWLTNHTFFNFLIATLYYISVVLPHNTFGEWIAQGLDRPLGRDYYNLLILGLGLLSFLGYFIIFRKGQQDKASINNEYSAKREWLFLLLTIFLIGISVNTIVVINIEIIHLVQYCILALLLFPLCQHFTATLFWVITLGAIDELYQYQVLNPTYHYYDFNDIVLDLLGGALGLHLVAAYPLKINFQKATIAKNTIKWSFGVIATLFLLGYWLDYITILPKIGQPQAPFQLVRKYHPEFWRTIHPNVTYHIIQPLEGICLIIGLFWSYSYLMVKSENRGKVFR